MTRRRILLWSEYFLPHRGGIESHVQALARRLTASGHTVTVATPSPGPATVDGVAVHRIDVPRIPVVDTVWGSHGVAPLQALLREERFDLVHCHYSIYNPATAGVIYLAQRHRLPTVVTFHSIMRGYTPAFALLDAITGWTRWPVTYTAVSALVADGLQPLLGERPIPLLPCGIEPARWQPGPLAPGADSFRVVSTMRLVRRKRPRALIDMLALVRERLPDGMRLQACILGDGPERSAVERQLSDRGLDDHVTLAGRVAPAVVHQHYAAADAFVLPTLEESFGLAALEARAAGLPVVAMRQSGPSAFVRHEVEGLLADSDAAMVASLVRLARDPALRRRITEHNRTTPVPYAWDEVLARHLTLYDEVVSAHGA